MKTENATQDLGETPVVEMDTHQPVEAKRRKVGALAVSGRRVSVLQNFMVCALLVGATMLNGDVYGHLSGELLDPLLVHEGREKERENLRKFEVYGRVPRMQARGKRVRVQWLDDYRTGPDNERFVRSRLVAMQIAWEARSDCFAGTPVLCVVRLVLSYAATLVRGPRMRLCALYDVSVAFYHALLDEDIWVDPRGARSQSTASFGSS